MGIGQSVTVDVMGGPKIEVPWFAGMNGQQALEAAQTASPTTFTFGLQYFGNYGYLVFMINETYDTFVSSGDPYYYWEFLIDGIPAPAGIDQTTLDAGTTVGFSFVEYEPDTHSESLLAIKHKSRSST
jgi:hypothetical protein